MYFPHTARPKADFARNPDNAEQPLAVDGTPHPENVASLERLDARFAEFVDYAKTFMNHSENSLRWYRRSYANFRHYLDEGRALSPEAFEERIRAIDEWIRWNRRRENIADISINTNWRGLRMFFKDLETRDLVPSPFRGMRAPGFRDAAPKALDANSCVRILAAAENYPWPDTHRSFKRALGVAVVGVMLYAGLRRGEVVRLQFGDIQGTTLRIIGGKGKFGGRDRVAYVSPDLQRILFAYLQERRRLGITQPELFVSMRTHGGLTLEMLRRILKKIAGAAGVKFSAHVLRHSFVSHLLHAGVDLHLVRDLAGHRNISTTLGYLRVFDEDLEAAIKRLKYAGH